MIKRRTYLSGSGKKSRGACLFLAGLLGSFPGLEGRPAPEQVAKPTGVVVEEVGPGSALQKAGVEAGDVLLYWERRPRPAAHPEPDGGEIGSLFDWLWLVVEQAPRGRVELRGERQGKLKLFRVDPGEWRAQVRPRLPELTLADYESGRDLIARGQLEEAGRAWADLAAARHGTEDWRVGCGLSLRMAETWAQARAWEEAHAAWRSALEQAAGPPARAALRAALGDVRRRQNDFAAAETAYRAALSIRQEIAPESLYVAQTWSDLGSVAWSRGDLDRAAECFERSLSIRQKLAPESLEAASSLNRVGVVAFARGNLELAVDYYARALAIRQKVAPGSLLVAASLDNLGGAAWTRGNLDRAAESLERGLAIRRKLAPESLGVAGSLNNLGLLAEARGFLAQAAEYHERALAIRERLAPRGLEVAQSLNNLGDVALARGNLAHAAETYERSLAIRGKLAPHSLDVAASLNNLGLVAQARGDLAQATEYLEGALTIRGKLAPRSLDVAKSLNNLGTVARARGDLAQAAEYLERALAIEHELAPDSLPLAGSLSNLGRVAQDRGDLARAAEYFEGALALHDKLAPLSLEVAGSLSNLGNVAWARDDLARAAEYFQRALAIRGKLAPDSLQLALSLNNLGGVAWARGDLARAAEYCERALVIQNKMAPGSLDLALSLNNLGIIFMDRGDSDLAVKNFEQALVIRQSLAPHSFDTAETLNYLGKAAKTLGDSELAADYFGRSIETLEDQLGKLGGSPETKGGFLARHRNWYRDAIELLLQMNRTAHAFSILERSRARSFLDMLAERDLVFSADLREELERTRRRIGAEHDRTLRRLSDPSLGKDPEKVAALNGDLTRLQRERDAIVDEVRKASPRFAALHYPQPLALPGAREALDPGTLMLSYSVGEERTDLFAVTREGGLEVHSLPIGREKLKEDVGRFRDLVQHPLWSRHRSQFMELSHRLYQTLIEPAADWVATSDRVLIVPDGSLHLLPWSALIRRAAAGGTGSGPYGEYLVEWKPLHSVLSATVYAELKKPRRPSPDSGDTVLLAAFGDPQYPREFTEEIADARLRSAARRGLFDWQPLPYSRREVEQITGLYPAQSTRVYLGEQATEERAKAIGRGTRIVHFAVHGHPDDLSPLNSGLALTIPEGFPADRDNGLLQVWEVFERVRLDADLVVLSACDSALGEEQDGEGLIGLTRAFQYAGARSVGATMWSVGDRITAELMVRFYRHLRSGEPKDAALRAAQVELIRGPIEVRTPQGKLVEVDASAPYFWAAFQIFGDWQ